MIMYLGDMNKAQDDNAIRNMNSGSCAQGSISQSLITANADAITSVKIRAVSGAGAAYLKLQPITSGSPETALFNINSMVRITSMRHLPFHVSKIEDILEPTILDKTTKIHLST